MGLELGYPAGLSNQKDRCSTAQMMDSLFHGVVFENKIEDNAKHYHADRQKDI